MILTLKLIKNNLTEKSFWIIFPLIVLSILFGIPKLYYDYLIIYNYPAYTYLFIAVCFISLFYFFRSIKDNVLFVVLFLICLFLLSVSTLLNKDSFKFNSGQMLLDYFSLSAFFCLYFIGYKLRPNSYICLIVLLYIFSFFQLCYFILLYRKGLLLYDEGYTRVIDLAIYYLAYTISVLTPLFFQYYYTNKNKIFAVLTFVLSSIVVYYISAVSLTRSVAIVHFASQFLTILLIINKRNFFQIIVATLIASISFLSLYFLFRDTSYYEALHEKLFYKNLLDDPRFSEVIMMFSQLKSNLLLGFGMGTFFESTISSVEFGLGYASVPHVGILTPLSKGGVIVFIISVIIPLFYFTISYFKYNNAYTKAYISCFFIYVCQSSLSGGWHYSQLFVLGIIIGGYVSLLKYVKKNAKGTYRE